MCFVLAADNGSSIKLRCSVVYPYWYTMSGLVSLAMWSNAPTIDLYYEIAASVIVWP